MLGDVVDVDHRRLDVGVSHIGLDVGEREGPLAHGLRQPGSRLTDHVVPAGSFAAIPFTYHRYVGSSAMHSTTTNNTRITIPLAGVYEIIAKVTWLSGLDIGERRLAIYRNSNLQPENHVTDTSEYNVASGTHVDQDIVTRFAFNEGDYIEVFAIQGTTQPVTIDSTSQSPRLLMNWVAPLPNN